MDWSVEDSFGLDDNVSTKAPTPPPRKKGLPKTPEKPVHLRDVAHTLFADKLKKRLSIRKSKGRSFHYQLPEINERITDFTSPKIIKSMSKHELSRQEQMLKFILEEAAYLWDLQLINDYFAEPLKEKQLISQEEFSELFGNIHRLVKKTASFSNDLGQTKEKIPIEGFGKVVQFHLGELVPVLIDYCSKKVVFLDMLFSIIDQNQPANELIQSKQQEPVTRGLGLEDLLVAPIFRFENYSKFTIQLLELTPKHHKDREPLENAVEQLHAAQLRINALVKENEQLLRISQLKNLLDKKYLILFNIFTFELEADVEIFSSRGNTENTLLLFSKTLLIAKHTRNKKSQLFVQKRIDLVYLDVSNLKSKENTGNRLVVKIFGEQNTFVFKSNSTRDKWEGLLRGLVNKEVQDSVRRMNIDLSDDSALPEKVKKEKGSESEKMKSLLNENSHLTQQLAKISSAMFSVPSKPSSTLAPLESPSRTPRTNRQKRTSKGPEKAVTKEIMPPTILLFYGPRFTGKTNLAKEFVKHFSAKDIRCAYIHENQLNLSSIDPTMRHRKIDADLQLANVSITRALLQTILDIPPQIGYQYIVIEGEFYDKSEINSLRAILDQLKANILICCCYAPLIIRKERNLKDEEVRQCKAFELPAKGVFVDTSKSPKEILESQILPLLAISDPTTPTVAGTTVASTSGKGSHVG